MADIEAETGSKDHARVATEESRGPGLSRTSQSRDGRFLLLITLAARWIWLRVRHMQARPQASSGAIARRCVAVPSESCETPSALAPLAPVSHLVTVNVSSGSVRICSALVGVRSHSPGVSSDRFSQMTSLSNVMAISPFTRNSKRGAKGDSAARWDWLLLPLLAAGGATLSRRS
jgi:hypothetical protein